jgi:hypothetical protein
VKRNIIFALIALLGCSDPDPDIANKFVGTYTCEQQTSSESVVTKWKIRKDRYKDRIRIVISVNTDFVDPGKQDAIENLSVDSVLVDSDQTLFFKNRYEGGETGRMIYGQAVLSGQELAADVTIINVKGQADSQRLKFAKAKWD